MGKRREKAEKNRVLGTKGEQERQQKESGQNRKERKRERSNKDNNIWKIYAPIRAVNLWVR